MHFAIVIRGWIFHWNCSQKYKKKVKPLFFCILLRLSKFPLFSSHFCCDRTFLVGEIHGTEETFFILHLFFIFWSSVSQQRTRNNNKHMWECQRHLHRKRRQTILPEVAQLLEWRTTPRWNPVVHLVPRQRHQWLRSGWFVVSTRLSCRTHLLNCFVDKHPLAQFCTSENVSLVSTKNKQQNTLKYIIRIGTNVGDKAWVGGTLAKRLEYRTHLGP